MKKPIAIILISLLAASAVSAQNVNQKVGCQTDLPIRHNVPPCIIEGNFDLPWHLVLDKDFPEMNEVEKPSQKPETPDTPQAPDTPTLPDLPEVPEIPTLPDLPSEPDVDIPAEPNIPEQETPDTSVSGYQAEVLRLVNIERAKVGVGALTYDTSLEMAASIRAKEIKTLFSHTRPNGTRCFTVLDEIGYKYGYAGENIAYGQQTPSEVVTDWMNSPSHRDNLLNPEYTKIGIGVYSADTMYWAQMFAS